MSAAPRYRACILATCCVPWDANYGFAEAVFRRSVRRLIAQGIRDLYIFGTAGEGYAVTESQFDAITRVFLEETRGSDVQGMVGLISLSLPAIIERIERAGEMGARRFQLSLPSWGGLRDSEMETFFRETCGRFPDCEFLHYNLARSGRIVTGAEYGRLATEYPNLVATKNSTADEARLESLLREAPTLRHFITEVGFAKAARLGEPGLLISFASSNPARAQEYFRAGGARDWAALDALQAELDAIIPELREAGAGGAHMDGAFDKMFVRLHDPDFPLRLLPPYTAVTEEIFAQYAERLRLRHPRWLP
jgi:dihydrodipicolinate synthase/N-acetylneuraminate lyase